MVCSGRVAQLEKCVYVFEYCYLSGPSCSEAEAKQIVAIARRKSPDIRGAMTVLSLQSIDLGVHINALIAEDSEARRAARMTLAAEQKRTAEAILYICETWGNQTLQDWHRSDLILIRLMNSACFKDFEFWGMRCLLEEVTAVSADHAVEEIAAYEVVLEKIGTYAVRIDRVLDAHIEHLEVSAIAQASCRRRPRSEIPRPRVLTLCFFSCSRRSWSRCWVPPRSIPRRWMPWTRRSCATSSGFTEACCGRIGTSRIGTSSPRCRSASPCLRA